MEWMSYEEARLRVARIKVPFETQRIVVEADIEGLKSSIPYPLDLRTLEHGEQVDCCVWHFANEHRIFYMECPADPINQKLAPWVEITTIYLEDPGKDGDWETLKELAGISASLYLHRPIEVQSRNDTPECTVYRETPFNWPDPVYHAKTCTEAESLLAFLKDGGHQSSYFIDKPPPKGDWAVFYSDYSGPSGKVYKGKMLGMLTWHCESSTRGHECKIKDLSGANKFYFLIKDGRVNRCAVSADDPQIAHHPAP